MCFVSACWWRDFYPRSPCGERLNIEEVKITIFDISIHALLAESDALQTCQAENQSPFLSTLSLRRATSCNANVNFTTCISIHALLAESDRGLHLFHLFQLISIHALLAESDARLAFIPPLSTYFYPRSPCGERPLPPHKQKRRNWISIHALLAESDYHIPQHRLVRLLFLSTLSLRRATICALCLPAGGEISIHALLAESDYHIPQHRLVRLLFLSTLSLRRATIGENHERPIKGISIHALLAESDNSPVSVMARGIFISIHALLAESDAGNWFCSVRAIYFYPRSPCGERPTGLHRHNKCTTHFYPRSPCGERRCCTRSTDGQHAFLSTLSLRRATSNTICFESPICISIHALLAESDLHSNMSLDAYTHISIHALLAESDWTNSYTLTTC